MSNYCNPPFNPAFDCIPVLTKDDLANLEAQIRKLEVGYIVISNYLAATKEGDISTSGLDANYLKMVKNSERIASKMATITTGSAIDSLSLFNSNFKLLKDSFDNFYTFLKAAGINLQYKLFNISTPHTLIKDDIKENTVFRINDGGELTIGDVVDDTFIGNFIHVRNNTQTMSEIKLADGVTVIPPDAVYLRRQGSSLGLMYIGNKQWDAYGELP